MDVVITGIGLLSALGNLERTWKWLLAGKSGIRMQRGWDQIAVRPIALIHATPTPLIEMTQQVITDALINANLSPPLSDCGVVVGSSRGNQALWETWIRSPVAPEEFADRWIDSLPNAAAVTTARYLQTMGPVLSPMAACATGLWAIAQGAELIANGTCERVIAGAVEAPITPLTMIGFDRMGALANTGSYPFDRDREGLVLGEGGAMLVLESAELAQQRQARIYGRVLGFGLSADGYHVSSPDPAQVGAISAVTKTLQRSGVTAAAIDFIHAHGTATRLNDQQEAQLIERLFPANVSVSSTKGATGHTLGASGALGVAIALKALQTQLLPPCVGLRSSEFSLNLVKTVQPAIVQTAMVLGFGFGGQNGAIVLGSA